MTELVIPTGYLNMQWLWSHPGSPNPASCALAARYVDGEAIEGDIFDSMETAWDQIRPLINIDFTLVECRLTIKTTLPDPIVFTKPEDLSGTSTQEPAAPTQCVLWRKKTVFGGKMNRGRMYMPPPVSTSLQTNYRLNGDNWSEAAAGWHSAIREADWCDAVVILHAESSSDVPPTELLAPGTGLYAEEFLATQRRRLKRTSVPAS